MIDFLLLSRILLFKFIQILFLIFDVNNCIILTKYNLKHLFCIHEQYNLYLLLFIRLLSFFNDDYVLCWRTFQETKILIF